MATINNCDRCTQLIEKLPCQMKALDREFIICNDCWREWLSFMGSPFYTTVGLPDRTKTKSEALNNLNKK